LGALFDLPPYKGKWPEIWIAAHGPRMLRAVGRYGDGFFPAFAQTPRYLVLANIGLPQQSLRKGMASQCRSPRSSGGSRSYEQRMS
jgi:alkanesulfonate monooxygenase SsuD/methylene tetrahydromethanopterin reductase-like flavin-dependent oxidoreductase (luciferase family)